MQHGQRLHAGPKALLAAAGFEPIDVPGRTSLLRFGREPIICCSRRLPSALRDRKLANIAATRPDLVATGNIGCITQLAPGCEVPVVHTVELLDWATGGRRPKQ